VEAGVREEIATAFASISASAEAASQLERVLELRRRTLGADDPATVQTVRFLGAQYLSSQRFAEAERMLIEAYKMLPDKSPDALDVLAGIRLAQVGQGKLQDAVFRGERALTIAERTFGPNDDRTINARKLLESTHTMAERNAGKPASRVVVVAGRPPGSTVPAAQKVYSRAEKLLSERKFDEAEKLFLEARELIRKGDGPVAGMAPTLGGLARSYEGQGKYAAAENIYLEGLELIRKSGSDESLLLATMSALARVYDRQGKYAEQESTLLEIVEILRTKSEASTDALTATRNLAYTYYRHGKYAEAEALYADAVPAWKSAVGQSDSRVRSRIYELADIYAGQGKFAQADDLFAQILDAQRRYGSPDNMRAASMRTIGWVRVQLGRPAEAEAFFREALGILDRTGPDSWARFNTQTMLGASLAAQHKYGEAEPLLLSGYEGLKKVQRTLASLASSHLNRLKRQLRSFTRILDSRKKPWPGRLASNLKA
jgi:tetratricopeptide (TPR) repeat protein